MENQQRICFDFKMIGNMIRQNLDNERPAEFANVTPMQCWAIKFLVKNRSKDIFQKDFENEFHIRRSTASQILSLMEKNELIIRQTVDHDARLKKIVPTEKALQMYDSIEESISAVDRKIAGSLTNEELETLSRLLDKIKKSLEQ